MPAVLDTTAPLLTAAGENRARGELNIYEERLMSQMLTRFLTTRIAKLEVAASSQPVVLEPLPGERHGIGLFMTTAVMA